MCAAHTMHEKYLDNISVEVKQYKILERRSFVTKVLTAFCFLLSMCSFYETRLSAWLKGSNACPNQTLFDNLLAQHHNKLMQSYVNKGVSY